MMARSAQCHQILYYISALAPTHAPGFDVMDVHGTAATDLARHELNGADAHCLEIDFSVLLHTARQGKSLPLSFQS
jgi:hypothetical protein